MWSMKTSAGVIIALWICILIYLYTLLYGIQGRSVETDDKLSEKLIEALESLQELRKQNSELKLLIENERLENVQRSNKDRELLFSKLQIDGKSNDVGEKPKSNDGLFSKDHEVVRRHVERNVWEIFYFLHSQFKKNPDSAALFGNHTENQLITLLASSQNLSFVDNADVWRTNELQKMTKKIQNAIERIQNPDDCSQTRALICGLDKECGFGCQLHHVAYCFLTAFGTGRTLVLKDNGVKWRYSRKGWNAVFQPVTKCDYKTVVGKDPIGNFEMNAQSRVVSLGIVDGMVNKPPFLPLSFPRQLADDLLKLHSNPPVYFVSQFIWYLMRGNEKMNAALNATKEQIGFDKGPIVGIQVRRTDKIGTEASFHSVEEYMEWVDIWFRVTERRMGRKLKRRVYIASDDPQVLPEAKKNYPKYEVFGDISIANTAQVNQRYTDSSLFGVITDIELLSECDYLVCTFSSQVCRMGFELMQIRKGDTGDSFHSLDDLYYYGGQYPHEQIIVEDYFPRRTEELELRAGDVVGIAGNHWDGFSKGQNRRTGKTGLYPSYKAIENWRIVDFPEI
ncbi:unnamed protein product [Auanema sp. JU1783]|nr:unnamed protein product [Auanema sp. JU1783]